MGLLSDSRGRTEFFNLGNVSILEATSSTGYFVGAAAFLSNFDVQVPLPADSGSNIVTMGDVVANFSVPILGQAVLTVGLLLSTVLMLYQIYDSATSYGRANDFDPQGWINSIPTGLTLLVGATLVLHVAYLFEISAVLSFIDSNYWYGTGSIIVTTATYFGISSQG